MWLVRINLYSYSLLEETIGLNPCQQNAPESITEPTNLLIIWTYTVLVVYATQVVAYLSRI